MRWRTVIEKVVNIWNTIRAPSVDNRLIRVINNDNIYNILAAVLYHPTYSPTKEWIDSALPPEIEFDTFETELVKENYLNKYTSNGQTYYTIPQDLSEKLSLTGVLFRHADTLEDYVESDMHPLHLELLKNDVSLIDGDYSNLENMKKLKEDRKVTRHFVNSTEQVDPVS